MRDHCETPLFHCRVRRDRRGNRVWKPCVLGALRRGVTPFHVLAVHKGGIRDRPKRVAPLWRETKQQDILLKYLKHDELILLNGEFAVKRTT